jgi:hypothetical protein
MFLYVFKIAKLTVLPVEILSSKMKKTAKAGTPSTF